MNHIEKMEIKTLKGIDEAVILEAFNHAFSDYFIPFRLTLIQLQSKMKADLIQFDLSVGVFEDGQLIAFILHGFDTINSKKVVYNGGTGVIPPKRGQGLTKRMYNFILPQLNEKRVGLLTLEVITTNVPAIKSYEKAGYQQLRELSCYKGTVISKQASRDISVQQITSYDWPLLESFWDFSPTWQNSKKVVNQSMHLNHSIGAFLEDRLVGYIIYNIAGKRIQQIAVHPRFRRKKIGTTLINYLARKFGNDLSIINIDKSSGPINAFFVGIGLENYLNQHEMKMRLNHEIRNK